MKLITWNTQWCKGLDGFVSPQRIVETARALADFDVLCLQEIAVNYPALTGESPIDQPQAIASLLPGYEVVFGAAIDERPNGKPQQFGTLIASRLPILQVQKIMLPSPCEAGASHAWMPRICTVCTVAAPWGPVRVMTTHLEYHNQHQRLAQARALRLWHEESCAQALNCRPMSDDDAGTPYQTKPHTLDAILCGDFNFEPGSTEYRYLTDNTNAQAMADSWTIAQTGQPHPPTFRLFDDTYGPDAVSCDFVFVSESLTSRVQSVVVDTLTQASDHQPVLIVLSDSSPANK
jgi:endonuclease/exonuclease/phosphatase family metal-dependent hydrolase